MALRHKQVGSASGSAPRAVAKVGPMMLCAILTAGLPSMLSGQRLVLTQTALLVQCVIR